MVANVKREQTLRKKVFLALNRVIHAEAGTKIQLHLEDPITYRFGYAEVAKRRSVDSGGDS